MAFNFERVVENIIQDGQATDRGIFGGTLPKITIHGSSKQKRWFGYTAGEFKEIQEELYSYGQLLTANFFIKFEPFKNADLNSIRVFSDKSLAFLATETNIPLFQANFEQVQAGAFQINRLTGVNLVELQINMLETARGYITESMLEWLGKMVNKDGTLNPPASYAGRVTIGVFDKDFGLAKPTEKNAIEQSFIVAPSTAMIDSLNANGVSEVLQIPITLTVLREFME